jgi:tRNA A37 threonylcarbamoyladenosine dehydratase
MSHKLLSHNPDLKRLLDEGYEVDIKSGYLCVSGVPYLNEKREILRGTLVCKLDLANDKTVKPGDHVASFIGSHPCNHEGKPLTGMVTGNAPIRLGEVDHPTLTMSCKPPHPGYPDYYEKVTTYIKIVESQAQVIDPAVTARTHKVVVSQDEDDIFHYIDTNSSRADVVALACLLQSQKIGIVGVGGTGSYVLDFVAKTRVKEIHIFDKDVILNHNAFRIPGALSRAELDLLPKKVQHLAQIYSKLHKGIRLHEYHVEEPNLNELRGLDFVFVCVDNGRAKEVIINGLKSIGISFIDVGMGINCVDGKLTGALRVTTCTANSGIEAGRFISFADPQDNEYNANIQIAELNALNAALAVIKWKKLSGFYHDLENEYNSVYELNINKTFNEGPNS